jgi:hypothetical protein
MSALKGQLDMFDVLLDELEGEPTPARAIGVLNLARELGWANNPFASFTIRLTREDALPFFATWHFIHNQETGKRSWRFAGARAQNGQALNYNDIKVYLQDPDVIHPEPPTSPEDDSDEAFRTALGGLDPLGPTASLPPRKSQEAKPERGVRDFHDGLLTGWGALL